MSGKDFFSRVKNAGTESGSGIVGFQSDGAGGKTNGYRKFAPSSKFNMLEAIIREEDEKKEDDPDPPFLTPEEQAALHDQAQAEIEQQSVVLNAEQPLGAPSAPSGAPPAAAEENLPPPPNDPPPPPADVPIDLTDAAQKELLEALDPPAPASGTAADAPVANSSGKTNPKRKIKKPAKLVNASKAAKGKGKKRKRKKKGSKDKPEDKGEHPALPPYLSLGNLSTYHPQKKFNPLKWYVDSVRKGTRNRTLATFTPACVITLVS